MLFGSSWNMGAEKKRWHPRGSWEKEAGHRLRAQAEGWNWGRGAGNGRDGALLEVQLSDALGSWRAGAIAEANTYTLLRYQLCSHESRKKVRRKAWKFIRHTEGKVLKMGKYQSPQNKEPKWKPVVPRSTVPTASKQLGYFQSLTVWSCLSLTCVCPGQCAVLWLQPFRVGHMKTDPHQLTFGFLCLSQPLWLQQEEISLLALMSSPFLKWFLWGKRRKCFVSKSRGVHRSGALVLRKIITLSDFCE